MQSFSRIIKFNDKCTLRNFVFMITIDFDLVNIMILFIFIFIITFIVTPNYYCDEHEHQEEKRVRTSRN